MASQSFEVSGTARWRTREASLAMVLGEPYRLTAYRELAVTRDGVETSGGRDDKPMQYTGEQVAAMSVVDADGVTRSGAYAMDLLRRFFDKMIEARMAEDAAKARALSPAAIENPPLPDSPKAA